VSAETIARRVLGALRPVDSVTGIRILAPLAVTAPGGRVVRNGSGMYVVTAAPGLAGQTLQIDSPGFDPGDPQDVEFTVIDPTGIYLPRRATFRLPRDPDPANAEGDDSLFRPGEVRMFPAPVAPVSPQWAVVRASLPGEEAGTVRAGALVRVVRKSDGVLLAAGLADARGEALVAVPGIPVTTWAPVNGGSVIATSVEVELRVAWDPAAAARPPDPDDLERRNAALTVSAATVELSTGLVMTKTL
jgi:hypothetical protein